MRPIDAEYLKEVIKFNHYPLRSVNNSTDYGMFTSGIAQAIDEAPTLTTEQLKQIIADSVVGKEVYRFRMHRTLSFVGGGHRTNYHLIDTASQLNRPHDFVTIEKRPMTKANINQLGSVAFNTIEEAEEVLKEYGCTYKKIGENEDNETD